MLTTTDMSLVNFQLFSILADFCTVKKLTVLVCFDLQGRFEIISLTGSFSPSESNGNRNRSLTISLAGSDGHVLGGGVAGMLIAATPVQVTS